MFFGHGCKQKSRCSYLHPRSDEESSNPKEEVDIVKAIINEATIVASHIEAKVIVGHITGKVDVRSDIKSGHAVEGVDIVSHVETKAAAVSTIEEAPLVVRDVNVLPQLQESDISPRLERSHSQVMENNAQFYGKNDVRMEEMPLPFLPHPFPSQP